MKPNPKTLFTILLLWLSPAVVLHSAGTHEKTLPNIILVMSDDQGFVDVGYQSNNDLGIQTPNIDQLVEEGLKFNRFYACPNCSPTRASVLTGRHPFRTGVFNPGWAMNTEELTIAKVLKEAGYTTAHFGKWHLGSVKAESPYNPSRRGFDYYLSNDSHFDLNPNLSLNGVESKYMGEGSEVIVDEAIKYIDSLKDTGKPLFILIWYGSPHGGFNALPQDAALYEHISQKDVLPYANIDLAQLNGYFAEITAMDRSIGTLRKALDQRDLADNTLLLFNSDNGNGKFETLDDLKGGKGSIWEGGLRVPAVAVWPAVIKEPSETNSLTAVWDIMPTLMDIAGVTLENHVMDGESFYPLLKGVSASRKKPLHLWFYRRGLTDAALRQNAPDFTPMGRRGAESKHLENPEVILQASPGWATIIDGKWKLHKGSDSARDPETQLFDIIADPGETVNLVHQFPEIVVTLGQRLDTWKESVAKSVQGNDYTVEPEITVQQ